MRKLILISLILLTLLSSCLVSKKKYDQLNFNSQKSIDSLALILDKTVHEYKLQRYAYADDAKMKDHIIDSMDIAVRILSEDTTSLSRSLQDAIKEYESERNKLILIGENLNNKSDLIDSLKNSL